MESYTNTQNKLETLPKDVLLTDNFKKNTGSYAVLESLMNENVEYIFGYPGGAIMPIYDALFDYSDAIEHILVRHEQGATHAAEGYARATGKTGVVFATSGPGATNLVTGLADAFMDSVPMVCIVGQVPSVLLGTDAFQESNVMSLTKSVTKWNYQIVDANEIPEIIAKAFHVAKTGKPGPVVIEITKDAQVAERTQNFYYPRFKELKNTVFTSKFDSFKLELQKAAALLNQAKQPLLIVGNGVGISKAEAEVLKLVEKQNIPTACTLHGLSNFLSNHPLFTGMVGMHGNYAPNKLTNESDVILAVGMRFDDRVTGNINTYAKQAKIIHIEIDPSEVNKVVEAEVVLLGDAKKVVQELLPLLINKSNPKWLEQFKKLDEEESLYVRNEAVMAKQDGLTMSYVIHQLSAKTKGTAVIVADVGQHQMMAARYYQFNHPNSYYTSGGLGTMGFALPAAMGAKLGQPKREVIAIIGDGCFQMTIQELATIFQYHVAVKIIVLNNHYLGMVRQWQSMFFDKRYSFVEMTNPDFSKVAQSFGIKGENISETEELDDALERMLNAEESYLLNIHVKREEYVFPMITAGSSVSDIRLF
ncbi:biosynthetic-type acetolactate synthase large subunit [Empedobacter brevis]|uniref:biosynthetic-type acetolactate synthase large subunit n=1 Tax=Empedobacter brevis TaxID=247 RepID=UPI00123E4427|nr:biosynthetic-type acetolactate synthase large subunit [Empedobacter brevis]QES92134.1 biosynthetic-type acetolactate synthase large subunit [Empedobacter brevis]